MTRLDDRLAQHSKLAIQSAADELDIDPLVLAQRLNQAEIARLVHLLNAAIQHIEHPGLSHRIEDLLMALTDGRMPSARPETELDWALKVMRRRRDEDTRRRPDEDDSDE